MRIAMIGTGYVGLVTGTCFADSGNDVVCVDIDEAKIQGLREGQIPIYEPGLKELVLRNSEDGQLTFTTNVGEAVSSSRIVYLAVGTPPAADGSADLTALRAVVDGIADHLTEDAIVVTKSTVPVGTNQWIFDRLKDTLGREVDVASNPEFLKEGAAIDDFMKPDRVVVGVRRQEVADVLHELYRPFLRTDKPFLTMSPQSLPWQGDVTDIHNRPSDSYTSNYQELEFAPPYDYRGDPEDVRSWLRMSAYAQKFRFALGGLSTHRHGKFLIELAST